MFTATHLDRPRQTRLLSVAGVLVLAVALFLILSSDAHAALQKLAGYEQGEENNFASLYSYLAHLRDAILPLAIPAACLTAGSRRPAFAALSSTCAPSIS